MKLLKGLKYQSGGRVGGGTYTLPSVIQMEKAPNLGSFHDPRQHQTIGPIEKPNIDRSKFAPQVSFDDIKGKGHTNEVNALMNEKAQLDAQLASLSDVEILGGSSKFKQIMKGYEQFTGSGFEAKKNELINSFERTKENFKIGQEKGNTGMYSMVDGKMLMKLANGQIQEVDALQAAQFIREGKGQALTVAEINQLRDTDPSLAGNYNLSQRQSYGFGQEKLNAEIRKAFEGLGEDKFGHKGESYEFIKKFDRQMAQEHMSGVLKSDNHKQATAAVQAAIAGLSQEQKDSLQSQAVVKLANSGMDITQENVGRMMEVFFMETMKSHMSSSVETETATRLGREVANDLEDEGKRRALAGGNEKTAPIGLYEGASEGLTTALPGMIDFGNGFNMQVLAANDPGFFNANDNLEIKTGDETRFKTYADSQLLKQTVQTNSGTSITGEKIPDQHLFPIPGQTEGKFIFVVKDKSGKIVTDPQKHPEIMQAQKVLQEFEKANAAKKGTEEYTRQRDALVSQIGAQLKVVPKVYTKARIPRDMLPRDLKANPTYYKTVEPDGNTRSMIEKSRSELGFASFDNWIADDYAEIAVLHDPKNQFERRIADGNNNLEAQELAQAAVTSQSSNHLPRSYNNQSASGADTKTTILPIRLQ